MTTLGEKLRAALDKGDVVKKTIEAWDNHEDQIRKPQQEKQMEQPQYNFKVGNNVMRETFNLVKRNPNLPAKQYIDMLVATGFKKGSVTSVLYQLIRVGQIHRNENNGALIAAQAEYTPIKQIKKKKPEPVVEAKPARKVVIIKRTKRQDPSHGIAALKADGGETVVEKFDMGKFTHHAHVFKA